MLRNQTAQALIALTIVTIILLGLSETITRGVANQLTSMLLLITLALAWNLVGGFGGQFSLGHSIFVGIGGYATAVFLTYLQTPLIPTVLAAGAVSALIGVLLAYPLLRLRGPYLAVGSLGMALAAYGWMINWDFTRSSQNYQVPSSALVDIPTLFKYAVILAFLALVSVIVMVKSPLGLKLIALRDDEKGAASLGVKRIRTLIPVWALSGLLTGLMGSLLALQKGTLTVDTAFAISFSLDAVIIAVIGGLGTISGPLIGAIIVFYLRFYSADFSDLAMLIEAVVVIVVVRFFPSGITGLISRAILTLRFRLRKPPASIATTSIPVNFRRR